MSALEYGYISACSTIAPCWNSCEMTIDFSETSEVVLGLFFSIYNILTKKIYIIFTITIIDCVKPVVYYFSQEYFIIKLHCLMCYSLEESICV